MEMTSLKIDMQDVEPCVKKLSVEIPIDRVNEEKSALYKKLAKSANVPGFRKGRAPRKVLEKMYAESVMGDAAQRLIQSAYREAIEAKNLQPVGEPMVDDVKMEESEPISFTATVEIFPEVDLKDISGISLTRRTIKVNDTEVDRILENYRERQVRFEPVEDRGIQDGDHAIVDYSATKKDGTPLEHFSGQGKQVSVDKNEMFEDFFNGMCGMTKGEEKEFDAKLPKDVPDPELADSTVKFKVKINEIKQKVLPEVNDDFAREVSDFDSLELFKADLKAQTEKRNKEAANNALRDDLMKKIIEDHPIEISSGMTERQATALANRSKENFKSQGIDPDKMGLDDEKMMEKSRVDAVRMIKEQAILSAFAKTHGIEVTDEDIDKEIEKLATMFNQPKDVTRQQLTASKGMEGVATQAFAEKTYGVMLEKITIEDKTVEPEELDE
ncbi:Cell division trigger factor [hydrothermal vent metagenome]|uniref:peptidylprolyl isomerase n=1 Tax=hydrothermal vent metagenome TaxID=652676 RepID=A0A3B1C384_9ZZZZ